MKAIDFTVSEHNSASIVFFILYSTAKPSGVIKDGKIIKI